METISKEAVALKNMFLFANAMPGIRLDDRRGFIENAMAQKGFDQQTFRLNIDLSDTAVAEAGSFVVSGQHDWWINEFRMGPSIGNTLDQEVHLEDGRIIARVIAVDCDTNRVLGTNGCIYQLGRRLVSPIEVSVSAKPATHPMVSAESFLFSDNAEQMAKRYIERREDDAVKFFKQLKWVANEKGFRYCVEADIYGVKIVHEMQPGRLHSGATWGELFFPNNPQREPIVFPTFDQFIAYMLAKYW